MWQWVRWGCSCGNWSGQSSCQWISGSVRLKERGNYSGADKNIEIFQNRLPTRVLCLTHFHTENPTQPPSAFPLYLHPPTKCIYLISASTHQVHSPYICIHPPSAFPLYLHPPTKCIHLISASTHQVHSPYICIHPPSAFPLYLHPPTKSIHLISASTHQVHSPYICIHPPSAFTLYLHPPTKCIHLISASTHQVHSPYICIHPPSPFPYICIHPPSAFPYICIHPPSAFTLYLHPPTKCIPLISASTHQVHSPYICIHTPFINILFLRNHPPTCTQNALTVTRKWFSAVNVLCKKDSFISVL